jgi:hypothetical protein
MSLVFIQRLTEMITRNLPGSKEQSTRRDDILTAICELIIQKMCEPRSSKTTCKESSIISMTGASVWSKTNFKSNGYHNPRSRLLRCVCTVPSASAIFKCILKSRSVRVLSTACDSASITYNVSKWRHFNSVYNRINREK